MTAAAGGAGTDAESGSSGTHTASTGTGSTQGYKPISSLFRHSIVTMMLVVLYSSTLENAYAEMLMFMLVSVISFYGLEHITKWLNIQYNIHVLHA